MQTKESADCSVKKEIIRTADLLDKFSLNIYELIEMVDKMPKYPPIIELSTYNNADRKISAITCICSNTGRMFAGLRCINIPAYELIEILDELICKYMNNAIIKIKGEKQNAN